MKTRLIAVVLLLTMLFGAFGCSAVMPAEEENGAANENFISGEKHALLGTEGEDSLGNELNLASTDENGAVIFQIVYDIGAGLRVKEQCDALAADIYDATGVLVPVVHSSERQKTYEVTVGEVKRSETIDVIDGFDLEDTDFAICVVGTRILIYAENDQALVSAVIYFTEQVVRKSTVDSTYAIDADYNYTYHPNEHPPVTVEESDNDRYVNFKLDNGHSMYTYARLSYTGNSGWRLQTKQREGDEFRNDGASQLLAYTMGEYALGTEDERFYTEPVTTSQTGNVYTVTGPDGSRVEITLDTFRMNFYTPSGALASTVTNITQNAGGSLIVGELEPGEAIFGTGERFNNVNQRGKRIEMFTKDLWSMASACYMVVPLLSSSRGSGLFVNNYEHMVIDLDSKKPMDHSKEGIWRVSVTGAPLDCYFYTTEKIADVIHNYSRLSGYANMPEEWTYGMIVCAYSPDLSHKWTASITPSEDGRGEGIYEMIANMEANDLPWTGVLAEAWGPYTPSKHADLKELCDYVHSLGKKFLVYMAVGGTSASMQGYNTSYLLTQTVTNGTTSYRLPSTSAGTNNPDAGSGDRSYIDITNPDAVKWFFDEYWDMLSKDIGVDGCKIDFCEQLPENYTLNHFDKNIPTAGSHHWYPTAFCAKFYDMISQKPDSGMCYTRGGGIGSQRAPFMWAGDQARGWSGIRYQLIAVLTSGLSGVPYMSYDMAGYQYGSESSNVAYESEVFLRGTQYSAFTVCIQTHGTVRRAYQFAKEFPVTDVAGNPMKDAEGNVIMQDYTYVTDIYRAYTKLHEHLTPYITELCEAASTTGLPVMRHMVLGWQDDPNVYSLDNQYMFGDAFLVAPILNVGTEREVYLPEGEWEDLNTGTVYKVGAEGQKVTVSANIAELPTFFNMNTESETARELVDGIKELYDYARSFAPRFG